MKRLFTALILLISFTSNATLLEISLDKAVYQEHETINGQLLISDIPFPIGGFSADIMFDETQLALNTYGSAGNLDFGDGELDLSYLPFANLLNLSAFTFSDASDPAMELAAAAAQGNGFVLANFSLTAVLGTHTLSLLDDAEILAFNNIDVEFLSGQDITFSVVSAQVPTPMSAVLLITGFLMLNRRKFQ